MTTLVFPRDLFSCFEENATEAGLPWPDVIESYDGLNTTCIWSTDLTPEQLTLANDCISACKFSMSVPAFQSVKQNIADLRAFKQAANSEHTDLDRSRAIKDLIKVVFTHLRDESA